MGLFPPLQGSAGWVVQVLRHLVQRETAVMEVVGLLLVRTDLQRNSRGAVLVTLATASTTIATSLGLPPAHATAP